MRHGYTEAYRLHGCFKPLHFTPRRKRATVLQTPQGLRALFLVEGGRHSLRAAQVVPNKASNHDGAMPDETLLIYIAATSHVVSTTIVVEREEAGHAYKV